MTKKARTKGTSAQRRSPFAVLMTCIGRRVELLQAFRRAGQKLGIDLTVHGADANGLAPAMHHVDKAHVLPPIQSGTYVDALLEVVGRHRINLLVPLIDSELIPLATAADRFRVLGCTVLISTESVVRTCRDKLATYAALTGARIDTPTTWTWEEALRQAKHRFPYFLKPRAGSAAMGNYVVHDTEELVALGRRVAEPIVQEFVDGAEHTLDVYTGFDGVARCVVPRKRLAVRNGEVCKGLVVKDPAIMEVGHRVVRMLGQCRGVVTVQCMVAPESSDSGRGRRIRVIEINPRFGGGVPLSIHAGADFPRWLLMELLGRRPRINPTGFRDDMAMLRYDQSVFVSRASQRCLPRP